MREIPMLNKRLDAFFNPNTIAIVGASDRASSWSKEIYANLRALDFPGPIYPINPKHSIPPMDHLFTPAYVVARLT